ncbi:hypothetical protein AcV5_007898 [Taiwanofungus camphoratus]|nr:hypothetical protein AcV5_007898 [Antrodia cinnamomea]
MQPASSDASTAPEPSRKRQRHDPSTHANLHLGLNADRDADADADAASMTATPVRDDEYYLDGADCVLRVEDTLFRVHRFLLARDSSAFQNMFSMPPGGADAEGASDERPICLYGESAANFRALLSALYALPSELQAYNSADADITQLLAIAATTHKYHFSATEAWAADALFRLVFGAHGAPAPGADLAQCSAARLDAVLDVALRCGHTRLADLATACWTERILAGSLRPTRALAAADRHGLRALRGVAYYAQLMQLGPRFELPAVPPALGTRDADDGADDGRLTRAQRQRLLCGHYSLAALWERLCAAPPQVARADGCTCHQRGCVAAWKRAWHGAVRDAEHERHRTADVVGRLHVVASLLEVSEDVRDALTPACRTEALRALNALVAEVHAGLADHFVDFVGDEGEGEGEGGKSEAAS